MAKDKFTERLVQEEIRERKARRKTLTEQVERISASLALLTEEARTLAPEVEAAAARYRELAGRNQGLKRQIASLETEELKLLDELNAADVVVDIEEAT